MRAEASETGTVESIETTESSGATDASTVEGSGTADAGTAEDGGEVKEQAVLGWTEDGKPDVYVDPGAILIFDDKFSEVGLPGIFSKGTYVWKDGEQAFRLGHTLDIGLVRREVARTMEKYGSGTYKYGMTFLNSGETIVSSEFVYGMPGEEEPGENGGSTAEPGSNTAEAPQPEPWVPTSEEVKLYAVCGTETPEFTENTDNAYSVTVMNSI